MRIGVDVDEVLAKLHEPWLAWINERWGTSYTAFTSWEVHKLIPEAGRQAYEFLAPWIYDDDVVKPYLGVTGALADIRSKGHRVVFVSSCPNGTADAKEAWLTRHLLIHRGKGDLFLPMSNKSNAPVDVLVDDHWGNIAGFRGLGILMTRSHNLTADYPLRVDTLVEFADYL